MFSQNFHKAVAKHSGNEIKYSCYHFFIIRDMWNILRRRADFDGFSLLAKERIQYG